MSKPVTKYDITVKLY